MRKKNKKRIETKYVVLLVIASIILLLTIYAYIIKDKRELNKFEKLLKDVVITTERIVTLPFRYVTNEFIEFVNLRKVYEENEILKRNLDRYDLINTQNQELKRQLEELKTEMNIDYVLTDYEYLNAAVINRNIGYWYDTITINKGSNSGIKKDMAVITSKGLIGKVVKTTSFNGEVKLITSSNSNNRISVIIENTEGTSYGILSSYDEKNNELLVEGISDNKEIKEGSVASTSGLNDVFPSGIRVGTVSRVEKDNYGLSKIVHIKPSADIGEVSLVSVLKRKDDKWHLVLSLQLFHF